jgi:hypothetical protein
MSNVENITEQELGLVREKLDERLVKLGHIAGLRADLAGRQQELDHQRLLDGFRGLCRDFGLCQLQLDRFAFGQVDGVALGLTLTAPQRELETWQLEVTVQLPVGGPVDELDRVWGFGSSRWAEWSKKCDQPLDRATTRDAFGLEVAAFITRVKLEVGLDA